MERLPLRPLLFVPAYLLLTAIGILLGAPGLDISIFWTALFGLGCFAFHFRWTFRALAFVSKRPPVVQKGAGVSDPLRRARRFSVMMILGFGALILYGVYLQPVVGSETLFAELLEMPLLLLVVFSFFGIFWISARAVCEAEAGKKVPAHSVVGTFLLFIYIVIGAPFIYRRLKKLGEQLPAGIAEPA